MLKKPAYVSPITRDQFKVEIRCENSTLPRFSKSDARGDENTFMNDRYLQIQIAT